MSDSDSDFAYESAGEDAELEGNSANIDGSESKSRKVASENSVSTETVELKTACTKLDHNKGQLAEVTREVESVTVSGADIDDDQDGVQCLENSSVSTGCVGQTCEGNEISSKDVNLVSVETEPKRVPLRLEKKLMEKSHSALNKTSDAALSESSDVSAGIHLENVPEQKTSPTSSWGWGSWGTSLLSSAASSVTTFTSQVSQGIGTVLETVETTLGAPPPEELAVSLTKKETSDTDVDETVKEDTVDTTVECSKEEEADSSKPTTAGLFSGVTTLTKVIENTGTKVIMGGLDTLELIGKKTIDILTEGDPGLRKKRAVLSEGMTLSQILRDAQNRAEEWQSNEDDETQEGVLYTKVFDDYQGLVHLEALEMLSKQCQSKVQTITNAVVSDEAKKAILDEIKDICEDLPSSDDIPGEENQDFLAQVSELMKELDLPLKSAEKIENVHVTASRIIREYEERDDKTDLQLSKEIYHDAICYLANFTAKCVEHFHKIGELMLVQPGIETRITQCSMKLTDLACVLSAEAGCLASGFCNCLNAVADAREDSDSVTPLITSVYLEASNSTTYIQDAFQLLIPVLQLASLQ